MAATQNHTALSIQAAELVIHWENDDYGVCRNGNGELIATIENTSSGWRAARGYNHFTFDTRAEAERAVLNGGLGW